MEGRVVTLGDKQEYGLAKYAVHVEIEQGIGVIGIGPITGSISKAVVEYGGKEVTEVPEGENFTVKVTYSASNPGFAVSPLDPGWSTSVTAISTGGEVRGFNSTLELSASVTNKVVPIGLGPMPANNITLRIKLWGNQDVWGLPGVPDTAPEDQW